MKSAVRFFEKYFSTLVIQTPEKLIKI